MSKIENDLEYKASTKICLEKKSKDNPYLAEKLYVSGYDIEELMGKSSISDVLYLIFSGELPENQENSRLFELLMISMSLPSPRHPASRAAMLSGISKTNAEHLLPISLMTLGGTQSGAAEVENSYKFIRDKVELSPRDVASNVAESWDRKSHFVAGFGQLYGGIDPLTGSMLQKIAEAKPNGKVIKWVTEFNSTISEYDVGILDVGLAACVFCELSLGARESVGLFQLLRSPGLLAYGMEQTHRPISAMPMLEDEQYEITEK